MGGLHHRLGYDFLLRTLWFLKQKLQNGDKTFWNADILALVTGFYTD